MRYIAYQCVPCAVDGIVPSLVVHLFAPLPRIISSKSLEATIFWRDHEYHEYIVLGSGARTDGPVLCDNWRARLVLGDMAPDGAFS